MHIRDKSEGPAHSSGPLFTGCVYRISRPYMLQGTERRLHPNREGTPVRCCERSPKSDSLPDLLGTDSHFRKDIIRDLQGVISGIILDQAILLGLGLTHSQANFLGIGTVGK